MGLFSSKQKRNFLNILGLQISQESELVEILKEENFTDYSLNFTGNFKLIDKAIFRMFEHKPDLSVNSPFNLFLENTSQSISVEEIKKIVDIIFMEYGKDRTEKGKWNKNDDSTISTYWEGREWIIDKKGKTYSTIKIDRIQINLHYSPDEGLDLSVIGANNLLSN